MKEVATLKDLSKGLVTVTVLADFNLEPPKYYWTYAFTSPSGLYRPGCDSIEEAVADAEDSLGMVLKATNAS